MPIVLGDILTEAELPVIAEAAAGLDFASGAASAGKIARGVKDNLQAQRGPATDAVLEKLRSRLMANPLFQAVAYPRAVAAMLISRTEGGGQYGNHIDNALIAGARADVSFTLFLSSPDSYEGGELVITDRAEDRAFKLAQGEAVVYPSDSLHRVNPVTSGSRLVAIGWITSWIRDAAQREILFDLWQAVARAEAVGDTDLVHQVSKSRSNLLRMWAG